MPTVNGRPSSGVTEVTTTLQTAAAAVQNGTALVFDPNDDEVLVSIVGSSAVLTMTLEVSYDGGGTYENVFLEDLLAATGIGTLIQTFTNPTTRRLRYRRAPGVTHFRTPVTVRVSGSVTVTAVTRRRG